MQSVLIVIHLMIVVALVVTVLLQRSEGGAIGIGGGGGFMTGRGQANALTRATAILAALFFATSLGLTFLARLNQAPEVTFQSFTPIEPSGGPAKEGEGKGSLLDQLQKMEDQTSQQPALPPGVTLPGQSGPAAPQTGQSLMQKGPAAPQGTNLPLPALPAAPLGAAAPAPVQPLPLKAEPSPQGQPLPK
jgi:preprotein translocase subunit SecG